MLKSKLRISNHLVKKLVIPFLFFCASLGVLSFFLVAFWPGIFTLDSFANYRHARLGIFETWTSTANNLLLITIYKINSAPATLAIAQVLTASLVIARCSYLFLKQKVKPWAMALPVLFLLWPLNSIMVLLCNRNFWVGWLLVGCSIEVFHLLYKKIYFQKEIKSHSIYIIFSVISFLSIMRKENLAIAFFVFILFCFLSSKKYQAIILALIWLAFGVFLPYGLKVPIKDNIFGMKQYHVTSMVNPLSYIIKNNPDLVVSDQDKNNLSKIIRYEDFAKHHHDYRVDPLVINQGLHPNYTLGELKNYEKSFYRIVFDNKLLFLKNRFKMFLSVIGLKGDTYYYSDELLNTESEHVKIVKKQFPGRFPEKRPFPNLTEKITHFHHQSMKNIWTRSLLNSALPSLLLTFLALSFAFVLPATAIASAIVFIRVPIIFLAAPVNHFDYIYSQLVYGYFILFLFYIEWKARKLVRSEQIPSNKDNY